MAEPGRSLKPVATVHRRPLADDVVAASPTALLLVDPDFVIVKVNAAAEMLINASAAQIVGRDLNDILVLPSSFNGQSGAFAAYDIAIATPKNVQFRADLLITPFAEHDGWRLVSLQAGAAAHRMGHRLERGNGARAAIGIAAMLAHEIKNPLAGISGAAQLLNEGLDDTGRRMTKLIRDEVDRIAALIDRMEGFTDTRVLQTQPENIHAIIDHARAVAQNGFGSNIEVRDLYDPSLPPVMVHRDSLIQIILNLLKNAAETAQGEEKRQITITTAFRHGVSVTVDGGARKLSLPIELCVIDDGPGAPVDMIDNLFDPFVSTKAKGQGLGLSLVDKLVRDMGGFVQYAREGSPPRTVFRLLLPRAGQDVQ